MKFFKMLKRLIDVYPYFVGLFEAAQTLLGDPVINGLLSTNGKNPLGGIKLPAFGKKEKDGEKKEEVDEKKEEIPIAIVKFY